MRRFKVICTQISGKGKHLFNYDQVCTEAQINDADVLVAQKAIVEIEELKKEVQEKVEVVVDEEPTDEAKDEPKQVAKPKSK
jgi:hypothetical protein